jgi:hypothetical protein
MHRNRMQMLTCGYQGWRCCNAGEGPVALMRIVLMRRAHMLQCAPYGKECPTTPAFDRVGDTMEPVHEREYRYSVNDELKECCSHTLL